MDKLEKALGYEFKNIKLLTQAMTHSSYANENKMPGGSNERLEFLGDTILSVLTSHYLYENYKHSHEGELTKLRSSVVCEKALSKFSNDLHINEFLLLGKGEKNSNGANRPSILADAFEAMLAAVFLDGGMQEAKKIVLRFIEAELTNEEDKTVDYKTELQEIIQRNPEEHLVYAVIGEEGPEHDKIFIVEVRLNSNVIGKGEGRSKKIAEQDAARKALALFS